MLCRNHLKLLNIRKIISKIKKGDNMRRCNIILSVILVLLLLFFPVCNTITFFNGYIFEMQSYILGVSTILIIFVAVILTSNRNGNITKIMSALIALLPIFVEINWIFYIPKSPNFIMLILMVLCFSCSLYLVITLTKPLWVQVWSIILAFVIFFPLSFFSFIVSVFSIGEDTVINILESPNKRYYAEIIDSAQGALGGNTFIDVYNTNNNFNSYLFKISKRPQRVYKGPWSAYKDIEIYWINENSLFVDGSKILINTI